MAWQWSPVALLGLVFGLVYLLLAATVYVASGRSRRELFLVGMLVPEMIRGAIGGGVMYLTTDPAHAFAFQFMTYLMAFPGAAFLLLFAGTFPSPFSAPFRSRIGIGVVVAATLALCAAALVDASFLISGVVPAPYAPWEGDSSPFMGMWILIAPLATSAFLLGVGVDALRRTPRGTEAHAQARVLVRAFTVRFGGLLVGYPLLAAAPRGPLVIVAVSFLLATGIAMAAILAHGILRARLFDIDLKVKWTLRKGTVAAAFLAVFFVVTEGAQQVFSNSRLGPTMGLVAAGLLVFAIAPLQRFADRLSDRAMPHVADTKDYLDARKRQVYRAALEGALEDGDVSDKERAMLARLAQELDLGPVAMHEIEKEAKAARAAN